MGNRSRVMAVGIGLALLMILPGISVAQIQNPGFEDGFDANGLAFGWTAFGWLEDHSQVSGLLLSDATSPVYGGLHSQRVETAPDTEQGILQTVQVLSGAKYLVTVWAYTEPNTGFYFAVDAAGTGDPDNAHGWQYWDAWNQWGQLGVIVTATAPQITLVLDAYCQNPGTAVYLDDAELLLLEPPVPEPSSLLALGAGVIGLAGLIRRRR